MKWFPILCLMMVGCGVGPIAPTTDERDYAEETIIAHIAIATIPGGDEAAPAVKPKVGDKCPACGSNDPRSGCPVGKTGDGRTCDTCLTCNGDGKIDSRDLTMGPPEPVAEPVPDSVPDAVEVQKEVTLHMTPATRSGWASKWYASELQRFEASGWKVRVILESNDATKVAYFDVVAPDGEVLQFYQPISLADKDGHINIRHLETR